MPSAKSCSLTGSTLKIIAIITMFIDHFGACVLENGLLRMDSICADAELWITIRSIDRILRLTGRIAFPIFCFLLVEGFLHTRNPKKYALRLLIFAFLSEIPFNLAIMGTLTALRHQNVFFTLFIGLLVMLLCSYLNEQCDAHRTDNASSIYPLKYHAAQIAVMAGGLLIAHLLHTDYSYKGVLLIELLYIFRHDRRKQILAGALSFCWELTAPLAFIPVWYYNGERGLHIRWFFYWFYPVHLLLLLGIRILLLQL